MRLPLRGAHDMRGAIARLARTAAARQHAEAATSNWASATLTTSRTSSAASSLSFFPSRSSSQLPATATRAGASSASPSSSPSPSSPSSPSIENLAAAAPKRPPRFFVEPEQLSASSCSSGAVVLLPPSEARHARKVLRLRPGAALELFDGQGRVAKAVLLEQRDPKSDPASARVEGAPSVVPVPLPRLSLAVAALGLKGGRGDWLVEKAAELGAASLVPLETERSPVSDRDEEEERGEGGEEAATERRRRRSSSSSPSPRSSRWRRLADAAGKQCLRPHALRIERAASVEELAGRIRRASPASCLALVAAEGAPPVAGVLLRERGKGSREEKIELAYLIVGPEGDFTPRELEALVEAGAVPVGLGDNRLRVETAAEALLAVAGAMLG